MSSGFYEVQVVRERVMGLGERPTIGKYLSSGLGYSTEETAMPRKKISAKLSTVWQRFK